MIYLVLAGIAVLVIAGFAALFFLFQKKFSEQKPADVNQPLLMLQNQINEISRTLDTRLQESTKLMHAQFGSSATLIKEVTEKLVKLDETNKQVVGFADQLRQLQSILQNPKQRGVFGEYYLETLLKNAFQPKQYQMQYKFKDGEIVDAVLFFGEKIIPIDSKFSLENYNRIVEEVDPQKREQLEKVFKQDLKNRIDETAKYIRPQEGTMEFAFMFIPAEGIYYDLLVNKVGAIKMNTRDLIDYSINEKRVHIVSPTTFYVTLQALWQGMRAYQIQESTKDILANVGQLQRHLKVFDDYFRKIGVHLGTTVSMFNSANREFKKIDKDVLKLNGEGIGVEVAALAKPTEEETGV